MKSLKIATFLTAAMLGGSLVSGQAAVSISAKPTQNMTCSGGVCTPTAKKAVLNVNDLATMLASGDATVQSGSIATDIEIGAALSWTSGSRLTLDSWRSISFKKAVVVAGTGALTILTNDGAKNGDFRFFSKGHVEFWDLNSNLNINGTTYVLESKIKDLARDIRHNGDGNYALAKSVNSKSRVYTSPPIPSFGGIFEGLGNTISHLTIANSSFRENVGFFGSYDTEGSPNNSIRDVRLLSANINSTGAQSDVGSLVGQLLFGAVRNSYATGTVSGSVDSAVGGLVGESAGSTISNSHAEISVSGSGNATAVGGLVGYNKGVCAPCFGIIVQSYATGTVSGGGQTAAGGLAGKNSGATISDSYSVASVSGGTDAFVGGLIGANTDDIGTPIVSRSYSTGAILGGSGATIGGLIGQDAADSQITNSYWDMNTSGVSDPHQGAGNIADDPGITGLTTEQFESGLPAGFSPSIWKENAAINGGYPYLIANPPQ